MSAKAISEASGKILLNKHLTGSCVISKCASVDGTTNFDQLLRDNAWLNEGKLVVKPDQLIKRRGKLGLIGVNLEYPNVKAWINEKLNKDIKVRHELMKINSCLYSCHEALVNVLFIFLPLTRMSISVSLNFQTHQYIYIY